MANVLSNLVQFGPPVKALEEEIKALEKETPTTSTFKTPAHSLGGGVEFSIDGEPCGITTCQLTITKQKKPSYQYIMGDPKPTKILPGKTGITLSLYGKMPDTIPFDLTLEARNGYGDLAKATIFGIEIISEGWPTTGKGQYTGIAKNVQWWQWQKEEKKSLTLDEFISLCRELEEK